MPHVFNPLRQPLLKPLLMAGLIAGVLTAQAQPAPPAGRPETPRTGRSAEVQSHMNQRTNALKATLKLTPQQQAAWDQYAQAMKPAPHAHPSRAEMDKLTTPERLDRMRELRRQRDAEMDRRDDATRAFYATLSAEQKKIFDANTGRAMNDHGRRRERMHGPDGAKPPAPPSPR